MKKILYTCIILFIFTSIPISKFEVITSQHDITVQIQGAVKYPGEYTLVASSNIGDLFERAVVLDLAQVSQFNLKRTLRHQEVIHVAYKKEEDLISINDALMNELIKIPEVGESTAMAIVEYRIKHGPFINLEDLMNVRGIKEKKFKKMLPYIRL